MSAKEATLKFKRDHPVEKSIERDRYQTFPDEYYAQLFRLRGLEFPRDSVKRPQYFGTLTNDIVWKRLAPGVLTELKEVLPKDEKGHRRGTFVQALTRNIGYPKLRELLGAVVAYMSVSNNYKDFVEKLDRFRPRFSPALQNPGRRQNARPDRLNMPCNPPAIPTANEQYPTQCDVVRRENESSPLPCNCHEKAPALRPGLCIPRRRSDENRRAPIRAPLTIA